MSTPADLRILSSPGGHRVVWLFPAPPDRAAFGVARRDARPPVRSYPALRYATATAEAARDALRRCTP